MLLVVLEGASMVTRRQLNRRCESRMLLLSSTGLKKKNGSLVDMSHGWLRPAAWELSLRFRYVGYARCDREICLVLNLYQSESLPSTMTPD